MLAGLGGKAVERSALIGEIDEYPVQVRQAQYFRGAWVQIHGSQFRAVSPRGIKTPNKLAYSRAVQVGNVPEVQQYLGASFPEDIDQQLMNGFTFYICEVPAHIYDRDVSQLTRIRAEVQTASEGMGSTFYRMIAKNLKCQADVPVDYIGPNEKFVRGMDATIRRVPLTKPLIS
jgi:hypothetical protein